MTAHPPSPPSASVASASNRAAAIDTVLVLVAHPALAQSVVNKPLLQAVAACGAPVGVGDVKLDRAKRRIDFEVLCQGTRLACAQCSGAEQRIHDRLRRSWRHLDFFQFEAWLHAMQKNDKSTLNCNGLLSM